MPSHPGAISPSYPQPLGVYVSKYLTNSHHQ